jgi:hypothetical protein
MMFRDEKVWANGFESLQRFAVRSCKRDGETRAREFLGKNLPPRLSIIHNEYSVQGSVQGTSSRWEIDPRRAALPLSGNASSRHSRNASQESGKD